MKRTTASSVHLLAALAAALLVLCVSVSASPSASDQQHQRQRGGEEAKKTDTDDDGDSLYRLPEGFLIGAGTSSYQAEGAWNVSGKGLNVMDYAFHQVGNYAGDVASDFYHRYKSDIAIAASLKFNAFRLSISWARIFPNGRKNSLNQAGVDHYHAVFDELLSYKITPLVTISHFDYPQALEDEFGGWLSEKMIDAFADYAEFLFQEYGDKVKYWLTLNEVNMHCNLVYGMGSRLPPGNSTNLSTRNQRLCVHHEILAHSAAYRRYRDNYKDTQKGLVGIGILANAAKPNSSDLADVYAAEKRNLEDIGNIMYPLVYGDYPAVAKSRSTKEPLPTFTDEQRKQLIGTIDFAGFNAYMGMSVSASGSSQAGGPGFPGGPGGGPGQQDQTGSTTPRPDHSGTTHRPGHDGHPGGGGPPGGPGGPGGMSGDGYWILGSIALWVDSHFGDSVKLLISENGLGGPDFATTGTDDWESRGVSNSKFLRNFVYTINKNKLKNVIGFFAWSFLDDVEFDMGYTTTGLVHVNFTTLERTVKQSAQVYNITMTTGVVPLVEASSAAMSTHALSVLSLLAVVFVALNAHR